MSHDPEFYAQQGAMLRQLRLYGGEAVGLPPAPPSTTGDPMIVEKEKIRAQAQADYDAGTPARAAELHPHNPEAQAVYDNEYANALAADMGI